MIASKYYEHVLLVSRIEKTTKVLGRDIQNSLVNYPLKFLFRYETLHCYDHQ